MPQRRGCGTFGVDMEIPLNVLLWCFAIAYCVHIVDESVVAGGFVASVRRLYWPPYEEWRFYAFNAFMMILFLIGMVLFEILGGAWIVFPLSFVCMFATNGIWHLLQTVILREMSPGLATSPIYWILTYFVVRYHLVPGTIGASHFGVSVIIGTAATLGMFGFFFRQRRLHKL